MLGCTADGLHHCHAAAVGAVATLWATKLVANAASSALDQQEEESQQLLSGNEDAPHSE
jgi:hypothetical protein